MNCELLFSPSPFLMICLFHICIVLLLLNAIFLPPSFSLSRPTVRFLPPPFSHFRPSVSYSHIFFLPSVCLSFPPSYFLSPQTGGFLKFLPSVFPDCWFHPSLVPSLFLPLNPRNVSYSRPTPSFCLLRLPLSVCLSVCLFHAPFLSFSLSTVSSFLWPLSLQSVGFALPSLSPPSFRHCLFSLLVFLIPSFFLFPTVGFMLSSFLLSLSLSPDCRFPTPTISSYLLSSRFPISYSPPSFSLPLQIVLFFVSFFLYLLHPSFLLPFLLHPSFLRSVIVSPDSRFLILSFLLSFPIVGFMPPLFFLSLSISISLSLTLTDTLHLLFISPEIATCSESVTLLFFPHTHHH